MDDLGLVIPTVEPITEEFVQRIRRADDSFFDVPFDLDIAGRQLDPIRAQALHEVPLYKFLHRIVASPAVTPNRLITFENLEEEELMRLLYRRTPTHILIRLREAIGWTLDRGIFEETFWDILIEEVSDPEVYVRMLPTSELLESPQHRADANAQTLIHIMLHSYQPHPNTDVIALRDTILSIEDSLHNLFTKHPSILEGSPDNGETLLDQYIRRHPNHTKHQYFVPVIATSMMEHNVPLIYWSTGPNPEYSMTQFAQGGVFHALVRNFVDHRQMPTREEDDGTLPIHYDNFKHVWNLATHEQRNAIDHRSRTLSSIMYTIIDNTRGPTGDLERILRKYVRTPPKSASGCARASRWSRFS